MDNKSFDELMHGYITNRLTEEELARFLQLMKESKYQDFVKETIDQLLTSQSVSDLSDQKRADTVFQNIMEAAGMEQRAQEDNVIHLKPRIKRFRFIKIAVAASVTGLLIVFTLLWYSKGTKEEIAKTEVNKTGYKGDALPGGEKAVLTLADGSTIVLDDAQNGALTSQGKTKIIKIDGKLAYNSDDAESKEIVYNTISTPRGGQYQIELADGSQVWLNAASSLRFPTAFTGKERRVEVTGEAYFEVAKSKSMPFIVSVNGAEVQVLGTHFNVNAYRDEKVVKTTLLEGMVKFVKGSSSSMLRPGQQSQLTQDGLVKVVSGIDLDNVMAWKNGMIHFEYADIETVMRYLSRWYDVDVDFINKNNKDKFYIEMPQSSKLSDVLRVLELTGKQKFEIEGKKIVVM